MLWNQLVPGDMILVKHNSNFDQIYSGELVISVQTINDVFTVTFLQLWGNSLTIMSSSSNDSGRYHRSIATYKYANEHCDVIPNFYEVIKPDRDM